MTYIRGDSPQFDAWEQLGNKGWNWNTMLEYFKKLEGLIPPRKWQVEAGATLNTEFHGTGGDIHTCFNPGLLNSSFYDAAVQGWASLGYAKIKDANAGSVRGFDVWPQTIDAKTNKRWDAASAFYWPVYQKRKNLKLINGTVTRILWDDKRKRQDKARAVGVQYTTASDAVVQITARKEIILAAGALNTPLILENSGVGQAALLESRGIPVIVDLPGVGENLVDNPLIAYVYKSDMNPDGYTPYATFLTAHELFGDQTATKASSTEAQLSQWAQEVVDRSGGALNVSAVEWLMTIQHELIFKKNVTVAEIVQLVAPGALAASAWDLLPFSRGSIHVSASSGIDNTDFDPQFLAVDFDLEKHVAMGKLARSFYATDKIRPYVAGYLDPPADKLPENASDDEWRKFVPNAVNPNNHALGTASMMARELGGVVDPKLKVYGISNVRVVDASVVPTQISGHLTATIYVIAERASEMILQKS